MLGRTQCFRLFDGVWNLEIAVLSMFRKIIVIKTIIIMYIIWVNYQGIYYFENFRVTDDVQIACCAFQKEQIYKA